MSTGPSSNPMPIVVTIGAMGAAIYVASSILLGSGNQISGLFFYLLIACGIVAVTAPRLAFVLLVFQSAYLDLFKRLMTVDGRVDFIDLFAVLGVAPVTVAGIAFGLFIRVFAGAHKGDSADIRRLMVAVVLSGVYACHIYFRQKVGIGGTLRDVANGGTYMTLLFSVPLLLPTPESISKCIRLIIIVYVPVALYGIYQVFFGFSTFELEYLASGLTIEGKQLLDYRVRPFSTLNAPTSLSVVSCSLAAFTLTLAFVTGPRYRRWLNPLVALMLGSLFVAAWAASTVRVGILLLPVALIGAFVFRSSRRTVWFYSIIGVAFAVLVASSSYIYSNIETWTRWIHDMVGDTGYVAEMLNMNTYKDRLIGFSTVLSNPSAWTLFGNATYVRLGGNGGEFYVHDPISEAILRLGIVPVAIIIVLAVIGLRRFHGFIFEMRDPELKGFAAAMLSNSVGNLLVSLVNGNLLISFPVNMFFWLSIAFAISLHRADRDLTSATAAVAAEPAPTQAPAPVRGAWRHPLPAQMRIR